MSRGTWNRIKHSKAFYIRTYREAGTFLILSIGLNFFLVLSMYYVYFNRPETAFYATSGVLPPIELTPISAPNNSATALLAPDYVDDNNLTKLIPQ